MHSELKQAIETLVQGILEYQSDTWDSVEYGVSREEAEQAAAQLIYNHLFDSSGCPHVDGADVGFAVETIEDC
jgi:hypothetical protein